MSTTKITIRLVDAMQSGDLLWDSAVKGFGIRCRKRKSVYVLKARINGRARWFTIGEHGSPWTPDTARKEAQRLWGEIRSGADLAAIRTEKQRRKPTMAELCDRFLEDYAKEHKKASSVVTDEMNIRNHIKPFLGEMLVVDVSRADIDRFKVAVKNGKTAKPAGTKRHRGGALATGGPGVANRALAVLSKMFNMAERWGLRAENSNPVRHVDRYKERRVERLLSEGEFSRLLEALESCEAAGSNGFALAALRLLILTGARRGEVLTLKWDHVELEGQRLNLPDSKTGEKTIHLSEPAVRLLRELPRVNGNPYVICGHKNGAHLVNLRKTWLEVRQAAGLDDVRIHDLRHNFASIAVMSGLPLPIVGKLLGHKRASTTERYVHLADKSMQEASEQIGKKMVGVVKV